MAAATRTLHLGAGRFKTVQWSGSVGAASTVLRMRVSSAWVAFLACVGASVVIAVSAASSGHAGTPGATTTPRSVSAGSGCSTAVASASVLAGARTAFVGVSGPPFGVAATRDGRWSFVDEFPGRVELFSDADFAPQAVRSIDVPQEAAGSSLTRDGRYLLVADGSDGATVVSVAGAEAGAHNAVLGTLRNPGGAGSSGGAIEVTSSPDGRYAFVSVEYGDAVAVYELHAALASGFRSSGYVGSIPLGQGVVGEAVSPDGRWLYVTSEIAAGSGATDNPQGTLSVISLAKAERDPAQSVVATVKAHCQPVRVVTSSDGRTVWVTARASDQLLAFSASKLISDPSRALLAAVRVGEAPVGLALVDHDQRVVVADSDRFDAAGAVSDLTVVSAPAALAGRSSILGTIPAGGFPREMALEPNGDTLLVGNFNSQQLEAVAVGDIR
jgi:DNA-binding beta-propeller fold protein YncE